MDLQDPTRKMSKSESSPLGTDRLLDPPEVIDRKMRRAVTDTETEVRYDPAGEARRRPTCSSCCAATTGGDPAELAAGLLRLRLAQEGHCSGPDRAARARPERRAEDLRKDPGARAVGVSPTGAQKAQIRRRPDLDRAVRAVGLLVALADSLAC